MTLPAIPQNRGDLFGISELEQMKNEFGIDVATDHVPLPSGGSLYPSAHPWHSKDGVLIKALTAHEEDILLNEAYAKKSETLDRLIQSCLIGDDRISLEMMDEMLLGDRNALMVFIRIVGYGPDYETTVRCPSCNKTTETKFDLGERAIHECEHEPVSPGHNLFEFLLPKMNKKVRFRLPIVRDEKMVAEMQKAAKRMKKRHGMLQSEAEGKVVTNTLQMQLDSFQKSEDEWVSDPGTIKKFVNYIPARDSVALRKFMKECEPSVDMGDYFECPTCSWEGRIEMPIGRAFFWPDA